MRYEDTSGTFSGAAGTPDARDDADLLPQGSHAPATGNVVSGAGTTTGEAGADTPGNGLVVALRGAGGTDASDSGASLHVAGRYGTLTMDEHGNYKYVPEPRAPQGVRDVFNYTLETKDGRDTAELVINLGDRITVSENAQRIVPGPDGVVNLPPGVNLSDVHVVGRDLVVTLPDGSQIVIVDGAVFVPQLVLGGVEVPSTNLATLLIENEPPILRPGGGPPQSSGGNFDVPVPPLDPGTPLGDLIPPTELIFGQPRFEEIGQFIDREPEAGTVSVQLDDDDVPGKNGNPGGVGDDAGAPNATTSGNLPGSGGDGSLSWDLLSSGAPAGFSYIDGPNGSILVQQVQDGNPVTVLTITIDAATGAFTVTENNPVRHAAGDNENNALFTINYTVTDSDGDTAPGTLNINVDDDTPTVSVTAGSDANVSLTTHDAATVGAGSEAVSTTADFSNVFGATSFSPGADGAGPGTTSGYALSTTGGASGLFSHGVAINLYNVGGVIVGSTSTTAPATATDASVVFSVSTTSTGIVTLTQYQQIDHTADPHPTDAPFTDDIISLADGAITLTRSLTVVDKDGDSVTGSAAVQIGANLHFVDDGPSIGLADHGEPNLIVDETDLSVNATASFAANFSASFGADGPAANSITYALGISAPGANSGLVDVASGQAIVLVQNGAVVEGHVGTAAGALAFTVSVNAAGDVTLNQILAVQHPDGTNPDDSVTLANDNLVTLTATAHDFDGDTAAATLNIGTNLNFEDDGPSISTTGSEPNLIVDETDLATNASASVAGAFSSSFGADGAGTVAYALGITGGNGVNSGLIDVATGLNIVLVNNAGVIEGHVGNGAGALAFTVSMVGDVVTLDQIRAVTHPNTANPDDSVTLGNDNLVTITATVTDKDGDTASAVLNFGQNLNFEDDGPSINANGTQPNLIVDETVLATNASASFAGVFTPTFGADGPATSNSVAYALAITGGNGVDSGLDDVATGQNIVLVNNGGVIEGHVGNAAGALAFTVTVNGAGTVTLDQIRAVTHPNAANPDDSVTLAADNLITLTATATDKDGDTATATANIGQNLNFEDDGPAANPDTDTTDPITDTAVGNVITGVGTTEGAGNADQPGADGFGSISNLVGFNGSSDNNPAGGFSVNGQFGTLQMDANGQYTYTRTGGAGGATDTFTYTYVDRDGDPATATLTITLADETPNPPANITVLLDDDALANGIAGGPDDRSPDTQNTTGNLVANGGDGDLDYFIAASQSLPTGFTSNLTSLAGVQTLQIFQNGTLVITVTLTNESGAYTVTQNAPIVHALDGNTEGEIPIGNILSAINVSVFAQDVDGDQSTNGTISISVDDDTPTVNANGTQPNLIVDETDLGTNASASFAGVFNHAFGADGAALANSVAYTLGITGGNGVDSGLDDVATGQNIVLVLNGTTVEGHVGNAAGALAFTVTVNGSGTVTLDQIRAVVHPNAANPDDSVTLANDNLVTLTQTVTDKDGDQASATANIGTNLNFEDDGPSINANGTQPTLTVDETVLGTNASASFAGIFTPTFGADGPAASNSVTYALGITGGNGVDSGLDDVATGQNIVLVNNGGVIEGHVGTTGGALAFTVTVDGSGNVTLDQILAIKHPNAANPDDSVTLAADNLITLTATATDKDGDQASATANIGQNLNFEDDGPSIGNAGAQPTLIVDETVLATNATASFAGAFTPTFGADGAAASNSLTYALAITGGNGTLSGLVDTATSQNIVLVNNGGVIEGHVGNAAGALAFTVSVAANGDVTLDQIRAVVHNDPADPDEPGLSAATLSADNLITLTATATDRDGDQASATINIGQNMQFEDDGPTLGVVQNQQTDNNPATAPAIGTLHFTPGADGAGATMTITGNVTGLKSGGFNLVTEQSGNVLTAYQDVDGDGIHDAGETTAVFTLTINPTAGTSGQYVFDLITPLDPTVTETAIGGSSSFGAGPTAQGQVLDNVAGTQHLAVVSGYHMGGTFNEATWLATGNAGPTSNFTTAGVNGSTAGWGIDNNNFNGTDEMFVWDFGSQPLRNPDGDPAPPGPDANDYSPPAGVVLPDISTATFDLIGYSTGAGDDITYVVHYTDGTFTSGHIPGTDIDDGTWKFTAAAGKFIADIEMFTSPTGSGKVDLVSVGVQSTNLDVTPSFTVQLTDGDGDATTTANFTVHIQTGLSPNPPAVPVVLDLNGDGVQFLGTDAGVHYDYGSGSVATAWADPNDGILILDANHNGTVDNAGEFVFGSGEVSDLQALAAFDSNHDGKLSAADANFGSFAVWQDANSNGVADAGEVQSLGARGIASISLSSDGIAYSAAGGDVAVAGTGSYTNADGSTGALADAAFLTGARAADDQARVSSSANMAVLMGAVAAAGLASQAAAAATTHASLVATTALTAVHNQALTPIALDQSGFDMHASTLLSPQIDVRGMMELQSSIFHAPNFGETPLSLAGNAHALPTQSPVEFLQGTQAPAHDQVLSAIPLSANVVMPSAQQLAGLNEGGIAGVQHNQVVAQVLADALHGGGAHGATLDALINALPNHGGGANDALASLASQSGGAVSFGDMGAFTGFSAAHMGLSMEHAVMVHQDAAPLHA